MRKTNSVKQLNRETSHRRAMMRNMAISLFRHERIRTTRARSKVLRSYAEKLITRAKRNLNEDLKPEVVLHNHRELLRYLPDREVVLHLLKEIAPAYRERNGGYIRLIHLPERASDGSRMSIVELVDRKRKVRRKRQAEKTDKPVSREPTPQKGVDTSETRSAREKPTPVKDKRRKWFWGFRKSKREEPGT